jgi:putative ABC transport system ATP-binding protein
MSIITISGLTKVYDGDSIEVKALRGIDLAIGRGEFTAIAGPSGSGKTTLLNLIGGLDHPTGGVLTVAGSDLNRMTPRELSDIRLNKIGFIFQAYNLIPVLSALENVEYILLLQGIPKEERRDRSRRILEEVGLGKEINRLPKEMSGGQQQRVAVARAIVSEPELVLADEPTANLDQKTGSSLLDLMHDLNHQKNITFLFSTHDQMVMDYAERLIRLSDGMIISDEKKKSSRESSVKKSKSKKKK